MGLNAGWAGLVQGVAKWLGWGGGFGPVVVSRCAGADWTLALADHEPGTQRRGWVIDARVGFVSNWGWDVKVWVIAPGWVEGFDWSVSALS